MTLHRFMSEAEYECLVAGGKLLNATDHARERGQKTTSVGFCFFIEDPDEAIHWLSGGCYPDLCVTMEVPDHLLRESVGTYRDPQQDDLTKGPVLGGNRPTMQKREYCCIQYSLADGVKVLAVTDKYKQYAEIRRGLQSLGLMP